MDDYKPSILVTGGLGFIGSHICWDLLDNDYRVIIIDDLSNSKYEVLTKLLESRQGQGVPIRFYKFDLRDRLNLEKVFRENYVQAVIHCAGLKAVGESIQEPLRYYQCNLEMTLNLLSVMQKYDRKRLIFSSSATVYGNIEVPPEGLSEESPVGQGISNPYGQTKFMIEQILGDLSRADPDFCITILRYFNPVGAHPNGLLGEDPQGIPNNLMPYILRVASGQYKELQIFGNDYETPDGTCLRDFIHVCDLSEGHLCALRKMLAGDDVSSGSSEEHEISRLSDFSKVRREFNCGKTADGCNVYNLGTGKCHSVLELVRTFSKVNGVNVPFQIAERRDGDLPKLYANVQKAEKELGWTARRDLSEMCRDTWNYGKTT